MNKRQGEPIPYVEFYNDAVNERLAEGDELALNFIAWKQNEDPDYAESNKYVFPRQPTLHATLAHTYSGLPFVITFSSWILSLRAVCYSMIVGHSSMLR